MEIMPSEYQQLDLSRAEKLFLRHASSCIDYGFLLLKVNPAMLNKDDFVHLLISNDGIIMYKFFDAFENPKDFEMSMKIYSSIIHTQTVNIIKTKLYGNKAILGTDGNLKFSINLVYVFPKLNLKEVLGCVSDSNVLSFVRKNCIFAEDLAKLRNDFKEIALLRFLREPMIPLSKDTFKITDNNINSILQRLAPEYVTVRVATNVANVQSTPGADDELLIVTQDDEMVKAFRLDDDQINIINKIVKGEQLILACAGSGKSVLLISKCFKAASMNPDKHFLITCYNDNLHSLYTWFIDKAGLRAKNVSCMTFHTLCKTLLSKNNFPVPYGDFDGWINSAIARLNNGQIKERYYGIFIDEVQEFNLEWYKFCYNLLENKDSDDHLFVICGDKTQKLKNKQKHGKAPWNAGEGYPNYRGGNKNIRIEKNYRNCIEINEYINRFVSNAKKYLLSLRDNYAMDPEMFLRGKSVLHGYGVELFHLPDSRNRLEAFYVLQSIKKIHNELGIPYDEIAVIMYNSQYKGHINGWKDATYDLETPLVASLENFDIPYCKMYSSEAGWAARYGEKGGVKLIKFASVLGLDFRAAIVCGMKPLGYYHKTKKPDWKQYKAGTEEFEDLLNYVHSDIQNLYVACTRAKEVLHIICPETKEDSEYVRLLEKSL